MTKWFTVFVLLVGCSTGSLRSSAKFSLDGVDEEKLKNGLTVLMLKDTSLPYFSVSMMVNMGAIDDPSHRKGLSSLVAELLDKGTQKKSATEIA
ncbi:MAG: insulinase family protein, partial [Bdellovibrionales bacterium]|nr:insulinase family protein [Bdellovibrionales bacterium]